MQPINLNRLAYFAAVVDTGSFTRAAERLGVTKTVVSQQITRLEIELGTSLLVRTTRSLRSTDAGRALHARCISILQEADAAFKELTTPGTEPRGTLHITAPDDFGTSVIAPLAASFTQRYPNCPVKLVISDSNSVNVEEGVDLAIRVGSLEDTSAKAQRVGTFQQVAVAAPTLSASFHLSRPQDLSAQPFIANAALTDPLNWLFSRAGSESFYVSMQPRITVDTTLAALAATEAGGGYCVLPQCLAHDGLVAGRLVRVLPDWHLPLGGIHLIHPSSRFRPPKVEAFVTMLVERLRDRKTEASSV